MPRGIPKNKEQKHEAQEETQVAPDVVTTEAVNVPVESLPKEKRPPVQKPILEPLGAGQAYFEAPDGTIIIGDETRDQVWYRAGNNGRGMWINKKR